MARVKLQEINKVYENGFHALHDINLDIDDGEFMVLVGPSGCAKSTMLRMVAGLESVSDGELSIGNTVCNDLAPKDRGIAMVFQNYALYPHMTAYENMAFGLETAKKPKEEIEKRVQEAAELLEITELLSRKPKQMSGGQRQRVALGRAMVRKPDVFLFDEPLSNLDAKLRVSMRMRISKLHQQLKSAGNPATMIYVTHDQVEAMTMGDRVCIMNKGHLMQVDTPMEVYNNPKNKFVAEFIGSPSMNMLFGQLQKRDESLVFHIGSSDFVLPDDKQTQAALWEDRHVFLGIRPEHLELAEDGETNTLAATITAVEELGSEKFIHTHVYGHDVICKLMNNEKQLKAGDTCLLRLNMDKCHLFDESTEFNIFYNK
ncbi:ABC transporter ATP-binding protein [Photobacterium rosenbergii]|uniref:ABC transporter ATP-binding protein n=1 Tax=Photobacterium rosenbergii TaxID=294936 RepID=UPI001C9967F2|nr:sn-glycerol-3-phosphate ABC transporter ATP-binding protein UgpC [Photobacterium rosenbergii]MBY5944503.1 sn-glycerol-3-phosphate ABC transporter ATP-binding protein UgpC [Photobacterium rosenbergii]